MGTLMVIYPQVSYPIETLMDVGVDEAETQILFLRVDIIKCLPHWGDFRKGSDLVLSGVLLSAMAINSDSLHFGTSWVFLAFL